MVENHEVDERPIAPLLARVLRGEASPEEQRAVAQWRLASRENDIEYQELSRLVALAGQLPEVADVPPRPTAAEIIVRSGVRERLPARRFPPWRFIWPLAVAAAAALAVVVFPSRWTSADGPAFGVREIATAASETATLELVDGTVVRLAPSARLRVATEGRRREVRLDGRAFFAVAKRNGEPFVIRTDAGEVTVVGTRLDVEARGRDLRLVVVEGRVALSTDRERTELTAGQMAHIRSGEAAPVVTVPDVGSFVEWTGTFLAFQSTPLADAAEEIERVYGVTVLVPDAELARRVITAWFWDKSLAEVVDVVCLAVAARCRIEDGVVRILPEVQGGAL